jgi:hypothetical protein
MSNSRYNDEQCVCGLKYKSFRTGIHSFADVRMMLWDGSSKSERWRYKRRNTVLGLWFQIKRLMWKEHQEMCEIGAELYPEAFAKYCEDLAAGNIRPSGAAVKSAIASFKFRDTKGRSAHGKRKNVREKHTSRSGRKGSKRRQKVAV